mgnify:CR=1 FL=1
MIQNFSCFIVLIAHLATFHSVQVGKQKQKAFDTQKIQNKTYETRKSGDLAFESIPSSLWSEYSFNIPLDFF